MPAVPNPDLLATLQTLVTAMLTSPKVHLYTAVANPIGPLSVLGDFTEATFGGYAPKTALFSAPYLDGLGRAVSDSPLLLWAATNAVTPNVILGFYVTDSADVVLLWCGPLPSPMNMLSAVDALPLILQYVLVPPSPPF
jgi:hypothetical protein